MMFFKQLDILLQNREIGERRYKIIKINPVIPHEYIITDSRPTFHSFHEILSGSIVGQRNFTVAIDIAQHDIHIRQWLHMLRRMHRIQISQRGKLFVREAGSQLIQKMNQTAGRASLLFIQCFTVRTTAVSKITVVLADGNHILPWVRLKYGVNLLRCQFKYFRISQTPLAGFSGTAFTINKGIIFRMRLSVYIGGHDTVECMYPHATGKYFRRLFEAEP